MEQKPQYSSAGCHIDLKKKRKETKKKKKEKGEKKNPTLWIRVKLAVVDFTL